MDKPTREFMPLLTPPGPPRDHPRGYPARIPWHIIAGHESQCQKNHYQTLERIAQRGGFSPAEALAVIENRPWHRMDPQAAVDRLNELVALAEKAAKP